MHWNIWSRRLFRKDGFRGTIAEGNTITETRGTMIRYLAILILAVSSISGMARAQLFPPEHRDWELELFGGASFLGKSAHDTLAVSGGVQTSRQVGLRYASGYQIGARVNESRWPNWGVSLEYGMSNQPLTFTNLTPSAPSLGASQSIYRVAYEVMYYPMDKRHRLRPYGFAGPGVALFHIHKGSKIQAAQLGIRFNDPWKLSFHWGGGVKYLLQDHVAAGIQFSDAISGVPHYGLPAVQLQSQAGFRPDGFLHNWRIGISFIYQWSLN